MFVVALLIIRLQGKAFQELSQYASFLDVTKIIWGGNAFLYGPQSLLKGSVLSLIPPKCNWYVL